MRILSLRNIFLIPSIVINSAVTRISKVFKVLEERKEPFEINLECTSLNEKHGEEIIRMLEKNNTIIIDCLGIMISNNLEGSEFTKGQEQFINDEISKRKALLKS